MYINKNIAISETGFVFNPLTGDSFSTNLVGQSILKKLQAGTTKDDLESYLADSFYVDRTTVERDLSDFFVVLRSYQILVDDVYE